MSVMSNSLNGPREMVCHGGPYNGQRILLECAKSGTLVFTAKGVTGKYQIEEEYCVLRGYFTQLNWKKVK